MWLPLTHSLLGTWPAAQACALTGNRTRGPLVRSLALNPLSHTTQGSILVFCWWWLVYLFLFFVGFFFFFCNISVLPAQQRLEKPFFPVRFSAGKSPFPLQSQE